MTSSIAPKRFIYNDHDMEAFTNSTTKAELLRLVQAMGKSCSNSSFQYDPAFPLEGLSPAMASFHGSLKHMERWVTELPPDTTAKARFGNPVFKLWHERLMARTKSILQTMMDCCRDHASLNQYSASVLNEALPHFCDLSSGTQRHGGKLLSTT